ncbi:MAG: DUF1015 domain-containing protein [Candidatus Omnitrophota bacterium]
MAEIKPFKGLVYNQEKIGGDYLNVVAPPYDVIPEEMKDALYAKNEYNVIRLILGKSQNGDDDKNNVYTRAKENLKNWENQGVIVRDDKPAIYIYVQEYECNGKTHKRIGFICLMKIGETGKDPVLPHEYTLAKPKADRMNLIKQVKANLSPIFSLYEDTDGIINDVITANIKKSDPVINITADDGTHKFWRLQDENSIDVIVNAMKDKKAFIADGHHRYEVAKTYRNMRRKEPGYDGSSDYVMMYFTDLSENSDLTVLATHRVVKVMPEDEKEKLLSKLEVYFDVKKCVSLTELFDNLNKEVFQDNVFGFFNGKDYFYMKPKNKGKLLSLIPDNKALEWKTLDVSVLHSAVLNKILAVDNLEGNITYMRRPEDAERIVKNGSHMAAFFLNPTRVDQLKAVAELGEMMPQKSTYFYPKLLTGLVINKFES